MEKNCNIEKYRETVLGNEDFFKNYYYHSIIDLNLVKLDSILRNGILSKDLIESNNLPAIYTHQAKSSDSKNGSSYVSLSMYNEKGELNQLFSSFAFHTLTSVSVLINKDIKVCNSGERMSFFNDEVFKYGSVKPSNIEGIIYPEHLGKLKISEICCLPRDMSCYTEDAISMWIDDMERYFNRLLPREDIMASFYQLNEIINQYSYVAYGYLVINEQRKKFGTDLIDVLASALEECWINKFHMSSPTFENVILNINDGYYPIYEIKKKSLKKIN